MAREIKAEREARIERECAEIAGNAEDDDNEHRSAYYVITDHFGVE